MRKLQPCIMLFLLCCPFQWYRKSVKSWVWKVIVVLSGIFARCWIKSWNYKNFISYISGDWWVTVMETMHCECEVNCCMHISNTSHSSCQNCWTYGVFSLKGVWSKYFFWFNNSFFLKQREYETVLMRHGCDVGTGT